MDVSIILCCYNSASRIGRTLEYLQESKVSSKLKFELILVDNNCQDDTVEVARRIWTRKDIALKVIEQSKPGLAYAREAGMTVASGEVYLFVDDDNWLSPDYLEGVWQVLSEKPDIAIAGGRGIAVCEGGEPDWFQDFSEGYAIGSSTKPTGEVSGIVGAGMAVRASIFDKLAARRFDGQLSGRKGSGLSAGEDFELCLAAQLLGYKCVYLPELSFQHFLPESRLNEDYLLRMHVGFGECWPIIDLYRSVLNSQTAVGTIWMCSLCFGRSIFRSFVPISGSSLQRSVVKARSRVIAKAWMSLGPVKSWAIITSLYKLKRGK